MDPETLRREAHRLWAEIYSLRHQRPEANSDEMLDDVLFAAQSLMFSVRCPDPADAEAARWAALCYLKPHTREA
jgi:hypothetical protein